MHRTVVLRMLGVPVEDWFYDSFGMKLEHIIFERPAQPDISISLLDERVVTKKMGRGLPPDVLGLSLPLALDRADEESDARGTGHIKELVRVGMTEGAVKALFGAPKLLVHYSFKGRASQYGLYQTAPDGSFGRFTFVDGVLSEFVDGGRTLLSQILNGG